MIRCVGRLNCCLTYRSPRVDKGINRIFTVGCNRENDFDFVSIGYQTQSEFFFKCNIISMLISVSDIQDQKFNNFLIIIKLNKFKIYIYNKYRGNNNALFSNFFRREKNNK